MDGWTICDHYSYNNRKGVPKAMKKPKQVYTAGFAHIMNENSFPGGRHYLIFISQSA